MFCDRLKELRENKKISQSSLAKELFVSQQTVAKWETNKSTPNPEMLINIADYFNVSIDYLVDRKHKDKSYENVKLQNTPQLFENDLEMIKYFHRLSNEDQIWIKGKMIDAFKQYSQNQDMETATELDAHITEDMKNLTKSKNKS